MRANGAMIGAHMESQGKIPYQEVLRFRHKDGSTVYEL